MPRSVQQSIPIDRIYADGVWQSENVFSLMWQISDINYAMQSDAAKQNILTQLGTVYAGIPADCWMQVCIVSQCIYSEAERKEIERVYGVFKDYIHASKFLDFVWSEKLGYLLLHIDPTKNTIEEDQIIASADELCAELFNEVATDVFQEAKREHFYPDADDDEIAEIRRRWQPYLDLLPEYRSSCRAFHTAE